MFIQDIAVRNAMVAFLVSAAQSALPNATAEVAVLNNFTVSLSASDSTGLTMPLLHTFTEALPAALTAVVNAACLSLVPALDTHFMHSYLFVCQ